MEQNESPLSSVVQTPQHIKMDPQFPIKILPNMRRFSLSKEVSRTPIRLSPLKMKSHTISIPSIEHRHIFSQIMGESSHYTRYGSMEQLDSWRLSENALKRATKQEKRLSKFDEYVNMYKESIRPYQTYDKKQHIGDIDPVSSAYYKQHIGDTDKEIFEDRRRFHYTMEMQHTGNADEQFVQKESEIYQTSKIGDELFVIGKSGHTKNDQQPFTEKDEKQHLQISSCHARRRQRRGKTYYPDSNHFSQSKSVIKWMLDTYGRVGKTPNDNSNPRRVSLTERYQWAEVFPIAKTNGKLLIDKSKRNLTTQLKHSNLPPVKESSSSGMNSGKIASDSCTSSQDQPNHTMLVKLPKVPIQA